MKKLFLFLILASSQWTALAQWGSTCLPEGITFTSQAQIDSFQINYPGCTGIEGNVLIIAEGISDLNGLVVITAIGGDLYINGNNTLNSLSGLDNLISIGGHLTIEKTLSSDLSGLNSLTSVGGNLTIGFSFSHFIGGNASLTSLSGLDNLATIGGKLHIQSNPVLASLEGLDNLDGNSITDLFIANNGSLSSCEIQALCDYLAAPNGIVEIRNNAAGCDGVTEIADACGVTLPCLPYGHYYFTSQNAIDLFPSAFPGCSDLNGNVIIFGAGISNLYGLSGVSSIEGELLIRDNAYLLASLEGLESLSFVGGNLNIWYNPHLTNLEGLENLDSVGGDLLIHDNDSLANLTGLNGLASISGSLTIGVSYGAGNPSLTSLAGLEGLNSVGEDLTISTNISLSSLQGLNGLTHVGGRLLIEDNPALVSLAGLENLGEVSHLSITNNSMLDSCDVQGICNYLSNPDGVVEIHNNAPGCNGVAEVGHECGITMPCLPYGNYYFYSQYEIDLFPEVFPGCDNLQGAVIICGDDITNLAGLNGITSAGDYIYIYVNPSLASLEGLENLTSIGGTLYLYDNPLITGLAGLENLDSIGGILNLYHNYSLAELEALEGLTYLGGLKITDNPELASLSGLEGLTSIAGYVIIGSVDGGGNSSLTSMAGLDNLASIGGSLNILDNNSLASLDGLNKLDSIGGSLILYGNPQLAGLEALESLSSIGGDLWINGNGKITSLAGLDNIAAGSVKNLNITVNYKLSACNVQSICEYLASPNGEIHIEGNAPGCNNKEEVEAACLTEVSEVSSLQSSVVIYPNPTAGKFQITNHVLREQPEGSETNFKTQIPNERIEIVDFVGKVVARFNPEHGKRNVEVDISQLTAGVYFVRINVDEQVITKKIIKL